MSNHMEVLVSCHVGTSDIIISVDNYVPQHFEEGAVTFAYFFFKNKILFAKKMKK